MLTSSIAAIISSEIPGRIFNETDWSDVNARHISAYAKSKHIAERAAWDFVRALPPANRFELAVINPGLLLGPILGGQVSASGLVVKRLLNREFPACPDLHFALVDVRDVAAAHVAAMTSPQAAGERFICANENHSIRFIAKVLADNFAARGFRVPTRNLPVIALRAIAIFDKAARVALRFVGRPELVDNTKIKRVLGWKPRPLEETIVAMGESMIARGVARPKGKPHRIKKAAAAV